MMRAGRARLLPFWRPSRAYCSSTPSGVIAAQWPEGLLQESGGKAPTSIHANLAEECVNLIVFQVIPRQGRNRESDHCSFESRPCRLLFEVGWQSRHSMLDVRHADDFRHGRVRGALSVPYEPASTFEERATVAIKKLHLEQPPAQHLAQASLPRAEEDGVDDDVGSVKLARLIICGDEASSLALTATKTLLDSNFKNVLALAIGFEDWKRQGLPCEIVLDGDDEFPDSTF